MKVKLKVEMKVEVEEGDFEEKVEEVKETTALCFKPLPNVKPTGRITQVF